MFAEERTAKRAAVILLTLGCIAVYFPTFRNGFVNFDDKMYVTENARVQEGLTWDNFLWAFTSAEASNWHPLTWLSHMADCQLYGLNAWGHHATSLIFHTVNTLLLLLVLSRMTGAFWRGWFVAALFALHPMHVESVAWVAERKDVLSTFFWLLTVMSYTSFAQRPTTGRRLLTTVFFAFGLMSKPMLVTLPLVLMLLDYWPLRRCGLVVENDGGLPPFRSLVRSACEKVPLLILAFVTAVITIVVQKRGHAIGPLDFYPLDIRVENALVSYVRYILKLVWPSGLSPYYPHPGDQIPLWHVVLSVMALSFISWISLRNLRRMPYLAVGWAWYLITLLPVIGLVQVGSQAMADRYSYVPSIGLSIALVWGISELVKSSVTAKRISACAAMVVLGVFGVRTYGQTHVWRDFETLFRESIRVAPWRNTIGHYNVGCALLDRGENEEAAQYFMKTLDIAAKHASARINLGIALNRLGRLQEAEKQLRIATVFHPEEVGAWLNLGVVMLAQKKLDEALMYLQKAASVDPQYNGVQYNLGLALVQAGRTEDAAKAFAAELGGPWRDAACYYQCARALITLGRTEEALVNLRAALEREPAKSAARRLLAVELMKTGAIAEAVEHYVALAKVGDADVEDLTNLGIGLGSLGRLEDARKVLTDAAQRDPSNASVHFNLAALLMRLGAFGEAAGEFSQIVDNNPSDVDARYGLGLAMLQMGKKDEARGQLSEVLRLKPDHGAAKAALDQLSSVQ